MMNRVLRPLSPVLLAGLLASACVQVYPPPATAPGAQPAAAPAQPADTTEEDKPAFEPWDEVLKDTEVQEGFFTFHEKRDRTVFLELPPDRLDQDFGLVMHFSRGAGDFNLQQGLPLNNTHLMRFQRAGDKVYLVHRNPRFTAEEGTRMRRALDENTGHSVVAAFDIKSQHEKTEHLLVDATRFFVSDYPNVSTWLEFYYGSAITLDEGRSHVDEILAFPRNVEIDAALTYRAGGAPRLGGFGVSDYRSVPLTVRYSLFALPEEPMAPRYGDDRVGHFLTALWDFSRDQEEEPWVRYVSRWRLEKADPGAELSEPVKPIVFYVDRSVPEEYRPYVREGIEAWNRAFEAAGFRNAIVARDAPEEDPEWSAEDMRYSTVRWTPGYNMSYAIGPSQTDPRTGEILNSDVLIGANFVRAWQLRYREIVGTGARESAAREGAGRQAHGAAPHAHGATGPAVGTAPGGAENLIGQYREMQRLHGELPPHLAERLCFAQLGKAHQFALGHALLVGLGEAAVGHMPEEYLGDAIRDLVMHEVGHSLGLRHNFKASSGIPHERLHDPDYTYEHGVSLSVMDYTAVNVSPDRDRQGHYWNQVVGTYDVWAIRYAYTPILEEQVAGAAERDGRAQGADRGGRDGAGASETSARPAAGDGANPRGARVVRDPERELPALRRIAAEVADPKHAYGTDEDNWLGSFAVDPLTNAWDLGSDPLAYARDRAELVATVQPRLEERLIAEGDRYFRLRGATTSLIFERYVSLMPVTKKVGGLYFHRDRKGDPGQRPAFVPVEPERQREAVRFIVRQAFQEDSFQFDPEFLNRLAPNRYSHWGTGFVTLPVDFPVHSYVLMVQRALLEELLAPPRLWRLIDNEARGARGERPYGAAELFETLTASIWSELGDGRSARPANSFRRNLQRAHVEQLVDLLMDTAGGFPTASTPEDGRSLARRELRLLSERIDVALRSDRAGDSMTWAHLEETKARIDRALDASLQIPVRGP